MARYDRATLNLKLAEKKVLESQVRASKKAGETTRYADLLRQLNRIKTEISDILRED